MTRSTVLAAALLFTSMLAPAHAGSALGVVLLHSEAATPAQLDGLAAAIKAGGFAVEAPEMCWSKARMLDRTLDACLTDIDAAIARLQDAGASSVVVGGAGLGAIAALDYGAAHRELAGVIALAPMTVPQDPGDVPEFAKSLDRARDLERSGKAKLAAEFSELVDGNAVTISTTPEIFLSFHGPQVPEAVIWRMRRFVIPEIKPPLLWIAGVADPSQRGIMSVFSTAPANPLSDGIKVSADRAGTPDAAGTPVVEWLHRLES